MTHGVVVKVIVVHLGCQNDLDGKQVESRHLNINLLLIWLSVQ